MRQRKPPKRDDHYWHVFLAAIITLTHEHLRNGEVMQAADTLEAGLREYRKENPPPPIRDAKTARGNGTMVA